MLGWLRQALQVLPSQYSKFLLFCTLTGLRGSECIETVRLLNKGDSYVQQYYNSSDNALRHYLYPDIFIRRTKAVYISIVNDEIIGIAEGIGKTPL
jgi:hypothetical protein